jgi:hypothetical protein
MIYLENHTPKKEVDTQNGKYFVLPCLRTNIMNIIDP